MQRKSFNEFWNVSSLTSDVDELLGNHGSELRTITLPHDAMILCPRGADNPSQNSGGFFPGGNYQYFKRFYVPLEDSGKTFYLEFEGISDTGLVFVNGNYAGTSSYAYSKLLIDISKYLHVGQENTVLVQVYNSAQPNSRWYTGSGLFRPVNMYIGNDVHILPNGLKITTPDVSAEISEVDLQIVLAHNRSHTSILRICTELWDRSEALAAADEMPLTLQGRENQYVFQHLYIHSPILWSPDAPNLYTCKVSLYEGDVLIDQSCVTFGIRRLQLDTVHGLRINGQQILLRGACIHHDNGILGAATFPDAEKRRIVRLKEAGFNAVRMAHHPASEALLSACDEVGMLMLDETFDIWNQSKCSYDFSLRFAENWEHVIKDVVAKDYNHPCVFMYSIGNELQDLSVNSGGFWSRKLVQKFKELDSWRFVTNAINGLTAVEDKMPQILKEYGIITATQCQQMEQGDMQHFDGDINDVMNALHGQMNTIAAHPIVEQRSAEAYACLDACGLNYMRDAYAAYAKSNPHRITYGSETLPPDISKNWKQVRAIPSCIGDFTWTGWDYIGEAGVGLTDYSQNENFFKPYPAYLAYVGDHDITGFRLPMSYYREIVFGLRQKPYLAVQNPAYYGKPEYTTPWASPERIESWTWPGFEGKPCQVEIYAASDWVELYLNQVLIGKYAAGEANDYHASVTIPYTPGTLEAVSCREGHEVERFLLSTAGQERVLTVNCDKRTLSAEKQDLAFIEISITDASGIIHTEQESQVRIQVDGHGYLAGFGSANPRSEENFFDSARTTYRGRLLAAVRSSDSPGPITIRLETDFYEPIVLSLESV